MKAFVYITPLVSFSLLRILIMTYATLAGSQFGTMENNFDQSQLVLPFFRVAKWELERWEVYTLHLCGEPYRSYSRRTGRKRIADYLCKGPGTEHAHRIHNMTSVTPASLAYIATQVSRATPFHMFHFLTFPGSFRAYVCQYIFPKRYCDGFRKILC
jgi:hypothetical protein